MRFILKDYSELRLSFLQEIEAWVNEQSGTKESLHQAVEKLKQPRRGELLFLLAAIDALDKANDRVKKAEVLTGFFILIQDEIETTYSILSPTRCPLYNSIEKTLSSDVTNLMDADSKAVIIQKAINFIDAQIHERGKRSNATLEEHCFSHIDFSIQSFLDKASDSAAFYAKEARAEARNQLAHAVRERESLEKHEKGHTILNHFWKKDAPSSTDKWSKH